MHLDIRHAPCGPDTWRCPSHLATVEAGATVSPSHHQQAAVSFFGLKRLKRGNPSQLTMAHVNWFSPPVLFPRPQGCTAQTLNPDFGFELAVSNDLLTLNPFVQQIYSQFPHLSSARAATRTNQRECRVPRRLPWMH